jgi:hypothetical protein
MSLDARETTETSHNREVVVANAKPVHSKYELSERGLQILMIPGEMHALMAQEAEKLGIRTQEYITLCLGYGAQNPDAIRHRYIDQQTGE